MEPLTAKQRLLVLAFIIPAAIFAAAYVMLGVATASRGHTTWRPAHVVVTPTTYGPPPVGNVVTRHE